MDRITNGSIPDAVYKFYENTNDLSTQFRFNWENTSRCVIVLSASYEISKLDNTHPKINNSRKQVETRIITKMNIENQTNENNILHKIETMQLADLIDVIDILEHMGNSANNMKGVSQNSDLHSKVILLISLHQKLLKSHNFIKDKNISMLNSLPFVELNKALDNIKHLLKGKSQEIKKIDPVVSIENYDNKKKSTDTILDNIKQQIDLCENLDIKANVDIFLNEHMHLSESLRELKNIILQITIETINNNTSNYIRKTNNFYTADKLIENIAKNIPIKSWINENNNVDLHTLHKRSIEYFNAQLTNVGKNKNFGILINKDIIENVESINTYLLMHVINEKLTMQSDKIANIYEKYQTTNKKNIFHNQQQFLESINKFIVEIKHAMINKDNINITTKQENTIIKDYKISMIQNIANLSSANANVHVNVNPIILTLPDFPLLTRIRNEFKKDKKRGKGENKCPCGSGKKLKDCCGANNKKYDD